MIGQRLRIVRKAQGLALRDLAKKIDGRVTPQAISLYERDASMPSSSVLTALADALDVPAAYLAGHQEIKLKFGQFRTKRPMNMRERGQLEAQILDRLDRYLSVEQLLGMPRADWDKPRSAPYPVLTELSGAERAAQAVRDSWGLGSDPIPNLAELLEDRGVKVFMTDLAVQVDGLLAQVERLAATTIPVIVVRRMKWGDRQRFTMAHELGHLLMSVDSRLNPEEAAHRFAGTFLMPAEALWAAMGKHRTSVYVRELLDIKRLFGVSVQALTHRCRALGIIDSRQFHRLQAEFEARGWSVAPFEEPFPVPSEGVFRFERLCLRALAEGAVGTMEGAQLLQVDVRELDRLVHAADTPFPSEGVHGHPALRHSSPPRSK